MSIAEKCLLIAVRDRMRSVWDFSDEECDIEFDAEFPAIAGDTYIAVLPGGWTPGPRNNTSGGVSDRVYSVDVTVVKRIRAVPRDRRRDVFLNNSGALNEVIDKVHKAIDWQYAVNVYANAMLATDPNELSSQGFTEPLRFTSVSKRPQLVGPDAFSSQQTQAAGLSRTITFGGARRITTITR